MTKLNYCQILFFRLFLLMTLIGGFSVCPVMAADPTIDPPATTAEEDAINETHKILLRQGKYERLDAEMNQIQSQYEEGTRDDVNLLHLSYAFYDADLTLEEKFNEWVAAYPRSYAARIARGIYLRRIARTARGTAYINETLNKQLDTMQLYLDRAMEDLQQSLSFSKKTDPNTL